MIQKSYIESNLKVIIFIQACQETVKLTCRLPAADFNMVYRSSCHLHTNQSCYHYAL